MVVLPEVEQVAQLGIRDEPVGQGTVAEVERVRRRVVINRGRSGGMSFSTGYLIFKLTYETLETQRNVEIEYKRITRALRPPGAS